jgi:chlorite dismutase
MVQPLLAQVANGQRYIPMKVSKTSDPRLQSWSSQFKVFTDRANIISDRNSLQKHFLATTIQFVGRSAKSEFSLVRHAPSMSTGEEAEALKTRFKKAHAWGQA